MFRLAHWLLPLYGRLLPRGGLKPFGCAQGEAPGVPARLRESSVVCAICQRAREGGRERSIWDRPLVRAISSSSIRDVLDEVHIVEPKPVRSATSVAWRTKSFRSP